MPNSQGHPSPRSRGSLRPKTQAGTRSSLPRARVKAGDGKSSPRDTRFTNVSTTRSKRSPASIRGFESTPLGPRLPRESNALQVLFSLVGLVIGLGAQCAKVIASGFMRLVRAMPALLQRNRVASLQSKSVSRRERYSNAQRSTDFPARGSNQTSRSKRVAEIASSSPSLVGIIQGAIIRIFEQFRLIVFLIGGVILIAVVSFVVLYNSSLFEVQEITVSGNEHISPSELTKLASVGQGSTLIRLDAASIEANIKQNPWVLSVDVQRIFPHTLNLALKERSIAAYVDVPAQNSGVKTVWALSQDGFWIAKIPSDSEALKDTSVLHITDVAYGVDPVAGEKCNDQSILGALEILSALTTSLKDQVVSLKAPSLDNISLILNNGVEIVVGSQESIRDKERICLKLMEENPGKISYINVRVPDRPTWRSA